VYIISRIVENGSRGGGGREEPIVFNRGGTGAGGGLKLCERQGRAQEFFEQRHGQLVDSMTSNLGKMHRFQRLKHLMKVRKR